MFSLLATYKTWLAGSGHFFGAFLVVTIVVDFQFLGDSFKRSISALVKCFVFSPMAVHEPSKLVRLLQLDELTSVRHMRNQALWSLFEICISEKIQCGGSKEFLLVYLSPLEYMLETIRTILR